MSTQSVLQEAVTALLLADAEVAAIVGEQIYDEVPAPVKEGGPVPPWIYLGPVNLRRVEAGCASLQSVTMRIFAASTAFGRRQAWELADAVMRALEGAEPDLGPTHQIVEALRCLQAGDVIDPGNPKTVFVDVTATVQRI